MGTNWLVVVGCLVNRNQRTLINNQGTLEKGIALRIKFEDTCFRLKNKNIYKKGQTERKSLCMSVYIVFSIAV